MPDSTGVSASFGESKYEPEHSQPKQGFVAIEPKKELAKEMGVESIEIPGAPKTDSWKPDLSAKQKNDLDAKLDAAQVAAKLEHEAQAQEQAHVASKNNQVK